MVPVVRSAQGMCVRAVRFVPERFTSPDDTGVASQLQSSEQAYVAFRLKNSLERFWAATDL
jgi:hypothetical protein